MPAIIRILSGPGTGREHWIESPVLRIGSHPDADLCIPNPAISSHAITLEFRNKQYVVHNRSEQAFFVGKRSVEKNSKATWAGGEELEFPGVAVLTLLVDRDPSPSSKPQLHETEPTTSDNADVEEVENDEKAVTPSGGFSPKEMIQLAVTICCVVGIVAILAFKTIPQKQGDKKAETVKLEEILKDRKNSTDQAYLLMVDAVQEACVLKSKGDKVVATQKLAKVRTQLHERRDADGKLPKECDNLYKFVASKLSEK